MNSKESIIEVIQKTTKPLAAYEIAELLGIERSQQSLLTETLDVLEQEGVLCKSKKNRYSLAERVGCYTGKIQSTKSGSNFFIADSQQEDMYIHAFNIHGAMNADRVLVRLMEQRDSKRREGEVIRIIERANTRMVGTFVKKGGNFVVVPDDHRLQYSMVVTRDGINGASEGFKVVAEISTYPTDKADMTGKVTELLGHSDDTGTDILSIIKTYSLPEAFPDDVLEAAQAAPSVIPKEEASRREDLRGKKIITIDGEDSKDLDDAVSVEQLENGDYLLGVHIADVSHYVQLDGILDKEAAKRGTSVYLIDRVLPMIPPQLSNGICSLNPHQDRLALSVFMTIAPDGNTRSSRICESIINTCERMTYTDVSRILNHNDVSLCTRYSNILEDLQRMEQLKHILRSKREKRGSIDFDLNEAKIKLDATGKPISITLAQRDISNQIVEEFMLACNETVAAHMLSNKLPAVFRVHDLPDIDKVNMFNEFIHNFGYHLRVSEQIRPKVFQELLVKLEGKPEELLISRLMLRSMRKAIYSPVNLGHFGLAAENYLHFTSPIRRYPDLVVHRILRWSLQGAEGFAKIKTYKDRLEAIAQHSSITERTAEEAERDVDDLKKAEYMQQHIGEQFDGIISGVTGYGIFVELPDTIEGFVHISKLDDDYYDYNEKMYALVGQRKHRVFHLGDKVKIRVESVRMADRRVEFSIINVLT